MSSWIKTNEDLPDLYQNVITLSFDGSLQENSIKKANIQLADGRLVEVEQWYTQNLYVTHWLDGMPELPELPSGE